MAWIYPRLNLIYKRCMSANNNNQKYDIAIIGPESTISGFRALGVDLLPADNAQQVLEILKTIKKQSNDTQTSKRYAIVCLIEDLVVGIDQSDYNQAVSGALPAVVLLPGPLGKRGFALRRLQLLAEKAVGSAII